MNVTQTMEVVINHVLITMVPTPAPVTKLDSLWHKMVGHVQVKKFQKILFYVL